MFQAVSAVSAGTSVGPSTVNHLTSAPAITDQGKMNSHVDILGRIIWHGPMRCEPWKIDLRWSEHQKL